ncbi:MAG: GAF domain-containing protein [candidate division Zixibacteria bacterium]|nr:GAF domain-containing protein [candidate division Zixibacteria bacterium]NIR68096.1 GAF domain-containing protein [candidate division Zixibacteria bacterium]NIS17644.1 GAF domain-containing protein [candidate division Zixibacteria bacterium]NIS48276.1 GAF domain-containing protein [candidate division Zixibacteria bacterium]NIT53953.1 GAF domain-containing protein [candidate division Zixibacteria bacterium]
MNKDILPGDSGRERAIQELSALNEIATAINVSMSVEQISNTIVSKAARQVNAEQGAIFLLADEKMVEAEFKTFIRKRESSQPGVPIHLNNMIKGWMILNKKTLLCNDPENDARFSPESFKDSGVSSLLATPLLERGHLMGLLVMFNKKAPGGFSDDDGRFMYILGTQVAKVIENARLFERETRLLKRVHHQRMDSLARLVAGVAHELNNPIGAINSSMATLGNICRDFQALVKDGFDEQNGMDEEVAKRLIALEGIVTVIKSGGDRVAGIVNKLKNFANLDQPELMTIDINKSVDDCLGILGPKYEGRIDIVKDYGDVPDIRCYASQVNQVLFHVILNALESIPQKGRVEIKTVKSDGDLEIVISDSGIGILEKNLEKIFNPGFTTKGVGVGVGLGLSICALIMEKHNGKIEVRSELGKGTSVSLRIPYSIRNGQNKES